MHACDDGHVTMLLGVAMFCQKIKIFQVGFISFSTGRRRRHICAKSMIKDGLFKNLV